MTERNNNDRRFVMMSGKALLEKLGNGEKMTERINGFFKKHVTGKTKVGNRSFEGNQFVFIPKEEGGTMVTLTENSAGAKMIMRQMEEFKKQHPDAGELGHYESTVTFEHVTSIIDRETGKQKDVDFLAVSIDPRSLGKRTFIPTGVKYELPIVDGGSVYQLEGKQ